MWGTDVSLLSTLFVAASLLTAIFLALWLFERRGHKQLRLNFQKSLGEIDEDRATIHRLSQVLNFRDGGVGSALVSFQRSVDCINDWVPELMSNPDMAKDVARVNQFLTHLSNDELVNFSHYRLSDATRRIPADPHSSKRT